MVGRDDAVALADQQALERHVHQLTELLALEPVPSPAGPDEHEARCREPENETCNTGDDGGEQIGLHDIARERPCRVVNECDGAHAE